MSLGDVPICSGPFVVAATLVTILWDFARTPRTAVASVALRLGGFKMSLFGK
jgi:hypothetical protein